MLAVYCARHLSGALDEMVIFVAGPVLTGTTKLTNRKWAIVDNEMVQKFRCKRVVLLNDLTALGYAVPMLTDDQTMHISGEHAQHRSNGQSLVVGVGTGLMSA
ncbi:MAG: glucokinase [Aliishimia sp.]